MASHSKLGIIAGGGRLPAQLIEACAHDQRPYFLLAFEGSDRQHLPTPDAIIRIDAIGEGLDKLRAAGVDELVLAGHMKRPSLLNLRPDKTGARLLTRLGKAIFGGDDALLRTIVTFLEEEGFRVLGIADILKSLLADAGILTRTTPDDAAKRDISIGVKAAKSLGKRDAGQAVIVRGGTVAGEEDTDGTDALIARCKGTGGVLVKTCKPGQEERADLPAIGIETVERVHAAGLSGIAIEAGHSLIIDKEKTFERANALGIFIVGVRDE